MESWILWTSWIFLGLITISLAVIEVKKNKTQHYTLPQLWYLIIMDHTPVLTSGLIWLTWYHRQPAGIWAALTLDIIAALTILYIGIVKRQAIQYPHYWTYSKYRRRGLSGRIARRAAISFSASLVLIAGFATLFIYTK